MSQEWHWYVLCVLVAAYSFFCGFLIGGRNERLRAEREADEEYEIHKQEGLNLDEEGWGK